MLQALNQSIIHWQANVARVKHYELPNIASDDCALCQLYIKGRCINCPVALEVKTTYCRGTPYRAIEAFIRDLEKREEDTLSDDQFSCLLDLCQNELDFLINLRTKLEQQT